jgi:alkaline phosphatase
MAAFAAALGVFSLSGGDEIAVGNLVLRAQKGTSMPLAPPPRDRMAASRDLDLELDRPEPGPRNVVLFIGDGMGIGHVSAAAALLEGTGSTLAMADTRHLGLVRTWAWNTVITDSAASGTALATGFKTDKRMIGQLADGRVATNLFEAAREHGLATGVITTSGLVDATSASFTAHVDHRDKYDEVLVQVLDSGTDILVGGDYTFKNKARRNSRYQELVADLENLGHARGYRVIRDPSAVATMGMPVLALLPPRPEHDEQHGPELAVSVARAVELLSSSEAGFVLVVESEITDELAHDNDVEAVMDGMRELDAAVEHVLRTVLPQGETLVLVTADHDTGALSLVDGFYEDKRAVIRWASGEHTSQWVPIFAFGPGAEAFHGVLDNTEVAQRMAWLLELGPFPRLADSQLN